MEADAVVHDEDPSVLRQEAVTGLAVRVVRDEVEERDPSELVGSLVPHREVVLVLVERHEPLHRTRPVRSVPQDGRGTHGHPSASATTKAATSRAASVPSSKSHKGASPERGL